MSNLLELADRVEALTGPDREVDAEIDCAIRFPHLRPARSSDFDGRFGYTPGNIKVTTGFLMAYQHTRLVDDALKLCDGFVLLSLSDIGADGLPIAVLGDPSTTPTGEWTGMAHNLASSLAAAALRAHHTVEGEDRG